MLRDCIVFDRNRRRLIAIVRFARAAFAVNHTVAANTAFENGCGRRIPRPSSQQARTATLDDEPLVKMTFVTVVVALAVPRG